MRKAMLLPVCALVLNAAVVTALYVPGAPDARAFFWLPFIPALLTFGSALFLLGGRRVEWDRFWGALVVLPRWAQIGLVVLFLTTVTSTLFTVASTLTSPADPQTSVNFERSFAVTAMWITAAGTALHYSIEQERKPTAGRR
ncbi:hypothetical protein AB0G04_35675 [Actinoplanes sp. NPDC023801]|uniref:hypothetical protein n=1 Tax=Actinoplanes sp. NPDC023801 TaxID=3154595 RepID=UPI0033EF762E